MGKPVDKPGAPPLVLGHEATRYAHALVCRRCGQDWPCTFYRGVPIRDRWVDDEIPPPPPPPPRSLTPAEQIRLAWVHTGGDYR